MLHGFDFLLIGIAATLAGMVNALAGGGTLITFPALTAVGIPAVLANVTNTLALLPGTVGGTLAQWDDMQTQWRRLLLFLPFTVLGGLLGGVLLLKTGERSFRQIVPFLILLASLLLLMQDRLRAWLMRRSEHHGNGQVSKLWSIIPIGLGSVYGGYFGAGLGVVTLAALGLSIDDSLTRLNALKQCIAFSINVAAAVFFVFSGKVVWPAVMVMAVCALMGGWLGGKLADRVKPASLRWIVVTIGVIVAVIYFVRG